MKMPSMIAEYIASHLSKNSPAAFMYDVNERIESTKKEIASLQNRLKEFELEREFGNERDKMILDFISQFEIEGESEWLKKVLPDVIKKD